MRKIIVLSLSILILFNCSKSDLSSAEIKFIDCTKENLMFPNNDLSHNSIIFTGKINGDSIRIIHGEDNFDFNLYTSSSFTTTEPVSTLGQDSSLTTLEILFQKSFGSRINIGLQIPYEPGNLNSKIQNLFIYDLINLYHSDLDFIIDFECRNSGFTFNSKSSEKTIQEIAVKNFRFKEKDDFWEYELEYSYVDLELVHVGYNRKNYENSGFQYDPSRLESQEFIKLENCYSKINFKIEVGL